MKTDPVQDAKWVLVDEEPLPLFRHEPTGILVCSADLKFHPELIRGIPDSDVQYLTEKVKNA